MWLSDKSCTETVEVVWASQDRLNPQTRVVRKIEQCGREMKGWSRKHFGNVRRELYLKRRQLGEAKSEAQLCDNNSRVRALKEEINDLMDKETRMWLQRSKTLWASHGVIDSKYFHNKATQRYRKNSITNIRSSVGRWCSNYEEVAETLVNY
ncbi:uncharacterized protein LOC142629542 [Castanea sativa]|uniref:uncharacterized protein LOC142629542 n=1 Tax=Castanea sativa TaxID=21020 RepID=UPI003F64BEF4